MKRTALFAITIAAMLSASPMQAQETEPASTKKEAEVKNWFLRISLGMPILDFELAHEQDAGSEIKSEGEVTYAGNIPLTVGGSLFYRNLGLSLSFALSDTVDEEEKYGSTGYFDIQAYLYFDRFSIDLIYQNYKGYYLEDAAQLGITDNSEIIRPDIKLRNTGINAYYAFSPEFSLQTAFTQNKRIKEYQWSFIAMGSINHFSIEANRTLVPSSQRIYYGDKDDYEGGNFTSISIAPGIALSVPFGNFYLSTFICVGPGAMYKVQTYTAHSDESMMVPSLLMNWRGSAGYNGETHLLGLSLSLNSHITSFFADGEKIQTFAGMVEFFWGIKF